MADQLTGRARMAAAFRNQLKKTMTPAELAKLAAEEKEGIEVAKKLDEQNRKAEREGLFGRARLAAAFKAQLAK